MKKTFIALIAALATAFSVSATTYTHSVVVNRTDGSTLEYKFDNYPVVSVEGENINILVAVTQETITLPMSEVENFTFSKTESSGIDEVTGDKSRVTFGITRETLEVSGLDADVNVTIYDINGVLRLKAASDGNGQVSLAIGDLGSGVFIVSAGNQSFKFIR